MGTKLARLAFRAPSFLPSFRPLIETAISPSTQQSQVRPARQATLIARTSDLYEEDGGRPGLSVIAL